MGIDEAIRQLISDERLGAVLTVVEGDRAGQRAVYDFEAGVVAGDLELSESMVNDAKQLMDREQNLALTYDNESVFVETVGPPPRLLIFGAVHIAQALCSLGTQLGYRVTVSDARAAFTTKERFPEAHELLVGWPDELSEQLLIDRRTFVVLLSHDARFEDPVLPMLMASEAKYIGAMGSRRTAANRRERLAAAGYSASDVARIHGPIGIDIGAETPEETAISILAEMIQVRYGSGTGASLTGRTGRIHMQRTDDLGDV